MECMTLSSASGSGASHGEIVFGGDLSHSFLFPHPLIRCLTSLSPSETVRQRVATTNDTRSTATSTREPEAQCAYLFLGC